MQIRIFFSLNRTTLFIEMDKASWTYTTRSKKIDYNDNHRGKLQTFYMVKNSIEDPKLLISK